MKKVNFVLTALLVLMISVFAQPRPDAPPRFENHFPGLNLTDSQQDKMRDLHFEHDEKMIDLRNEMEKARLELRKLKSDDKFNISDAKDLIDKQRDIRNKIHDEKFILWSSVYEILDASQKEIWQKNLMPKFGGDRDCRNNCGKPHKGPKNF